MNKIITIIIGLILFLAPIYAWIMDFAGFGTAALMFLQGGIIWLLILIGLAMVSIGFASLRD